MPKKFKDDKYYVKKNDIDAIRKRPSMYIASVNEAGVFHLCKEIIDNNCDECSKFFNNILYLDALKLNILHLFVKNDH